MLIATILGCESKKKKTEIIDGVKYVHNGEFPLEQINLEKDIVIDGDGLGEGTFFVNPVAIKEDSYGNIYVLDGGDHNIKKYSNDGNIIKIIGNKGKAPGYFINPSDLAFFSNNDLLVADAGNGRFQILDKDGKYLSTFKVDGRLVSIVIDSADRIYNHSFVAAEIIDKPYIIDVYNRKGKRLKQFGKTKDFGTIMKNMCGNEIKISIGHQDRIFVAYRVNNLIKIFERGKLELVFYRKLHFKPILMTESNSSKGNSFIYYDPITSGISVDSKGNCYVITAYKSSIKDKSHKESINHILEIFDSDGELIHKIPLKEKVPIYIYIGAKDNIYIIDSAVSKVTRYEAFSF